MLNRTTILILAAAIGAASLVSSTAFAKSNQGPGNQGVGLSGNGGGTAAYAATTTVRSAPCNCLTKEYLADGSVLFKDLCTKEAAVSPAPQVQQQSAR